MKRRGYEHLALRLAKRECVAAPPGSVAPQSRRLAENVVPDHAVPGLAPPPNTVIHSFSPCGQYLIAFQLVSSEVVAYRFKGLHTSSAAGETSEPQPGGAAAGAAGGAPEQGSSQLSQQEQWQQQPQPSFSSSQTSQSAHRQESSGGGRQAAASAQAWQPAFSDVFEEHWRCCPCPGRQEQINPEYCAVAHGGLLLVCTASPEQLPPPGASGAADLVPWVDTTTLHLIELGTGCLLDSHTLRGDFFELARSQGAHLWGQLLLVLGLATQTLHVLQVLPAGRLLYLHAVGEHCRDDDALVISQHDAAERRTRLSIRLLRHRQRQQQTAASNTAAFVGPSLSLPPLNGGAGGGGATAGAPAGAATAAAAAAAAAAAGVATRGGGGSSLGRAGMGASESDSEGEDSGGQPVGVAPGGDPSPLLGGLKQCLLAYLYREAQQQAQATAEAAAAAATTQGQPPSGGGSGMDNASLGGLGVAGGSTASLLGAAAVGHNGAGVRAGGPGGLVGSSSAGSLAGGGVQQARSAFSRPLDRFCFYFQAFCELVMWKAQVLDEQRLLIHWCPPEVLGGPHQRNGHAASSSAGHGTAGSYVMLYNFVQPAVERLFVAHSSEFAAWYLSHPTAFSASGCGCGCGSEWERCVVPPGASRTAWEKQQRDPHLAAKDLRHRLAEELPASSQTQQASPYLDPDLYCFDERSLGGPIRPHHPPHRALKFMCRCQPERLRFRLDPEHVMQVPAGTAGGAGSRAAALAARARHVVYLFHPYQPFLLVVSQDVESATAEHLAVFTRL